MFAAIVLICALDGSTCASVTNTMLYETEEQCWAAINEYKALTQQVLVVIGADCYSWNSPVFDEQT